MERQSEKYTSQGNISAQGIQRLLGKPSIDQLQTVIREAVQNTWDAREEGRTPIFSVYLRTLSKAERKILRTRVFDDLIGDDCEKLTSVLDKDDIRVLTLADYGTTGLGGPTDASVIDSDSDITDFVDLVRNIGSPRDSVMGGGTYGYGKSALYSLSSCNTLIVDTITSYKEKAVRRLIGTRVSSSFVIRNGENKGRYTGRHWWGRYKKSAPDVLEPLTSSGSARFSIALGMPDRNEGDKGTSIMILDPNVAEKSDVLINSIQRSLLWNFWPKMLKSGTSDASMEFHTYLEGKEVPLPDPRDVPPLNLYVNAMFSIKDGSAESIDCQKPKKHLGMCQIERGPKEVRAPGFESGEDGMFLEPSCHVALLRPAELVIKYLRGSPLPSESVEWGGAFLCSDDPEVEKAFADSEPPAHDDWNPVFLPKGYAKTYVKVALKRIKEQMEVLAPARIIEGSDSGTLLAPVSTRLGALLSTTVLSEPGRINASGKGRKAAAKRQARIVNFTAWGPDVWDDGEVLAWFTFNVEGPINKSVSLSGVARAYIDGEVSNFAPNGARPEIRLWANKGMKVLGYESEVIVKIPEAATIWVGVSIPDEVGIVFHPDLSLI